MTDRDGLRGGYVSNMISNILKSVLWGLVYLTTLRGGLKTMTDRGCLHAEYVLNMIPNILLKYYA